jgi:hypothetical protein
MKQIFKIFALVLLGFGVLGSTALAAEFISPKPEDGGNVTLSTTETHRNLYAAGGNVTVNSTTIGDLYVAGGNVSVDGPVEEDINAGAGTLSINAAVGGDIRVMAGNVTINAPVGGDVLIAGGTVTLSSRSQIQGDVIAAGGTITVAAPVTGNVKIVGGSVTINSRITGTVMVRTDQQLTFGPQAVVAGAIRHYGTREAVVQPGASISSINFERQEPRSRDWRGWMTAGLLVQFLGWLIVALIITRLMPRHVHALVGSMASDPWVNLGIGFAGIILIPLAVVVLLITLVGYYAAFLLLAFYVTALLITGELSSRLADNGFRNCDFYACWPDSDYWMGGASSGFAHGVWGIAAAYSRTYYS